MKSNVPKISYTSSVTEIPRATSLPEFRSRCQENKGPVAYMITPQEKDLLPALEKWNPDYFIGSNLDVKVHRCQGHRMFDLVHTSILDLAKSLRQHSTTLGQFVQRIQEQRQHSTSGTFIRNNANLHPNSVVETELLAGTDLYLRHNFEDRPYFQELMQDLGQLEQFLPISADQVRTIGLWISSNATTKKDNNNDALSSPAFLSSQTHYDRDGDHNMNFQIQGTKLFTLYAPDNGQAHLYPLPLARLSHLALVDPYKAADVQQFPRLQKTQPHVIELQAGEILFIPAFWWHDVRHVGDFNVNITAWYPPESSSCRPAPHKLWTSFGSRWSSGTPQQPQSTWHDYKDTLVAWHCVGKLVIVVLIMVLLEVMDKVKQLLGKTVPWFNEDTTLEYARHQRRPSGKEL